MTEDDGDDDTKSVAKSEARSNASDDLSVRAHLALFPETLPRQNVAADSVWRAGCIRGRAHGCRVEQR